MKIDVLTLFPEMFSGVFNDSILKRAQERGAVELKTPENISGNNVKTSIFIIITLLTLQ